jgi:trimethylamine--corrinoid protein Co-methyltransferase
LGSEAAVRERPFFTIHDSTALSPLRHDPKNAEVLLEACRRGFPTGLVAWPMLGLTSPVTIAGTMAQRNASALVGLILAQTVNPGNPYIIQMTCGGIDMRTGNVVTASPEIALAGMVGAQMARRYGLPSVIIASTDAKIPDAQAGAEKTFMLTSAALAGVNLIHGSTSEMDGMMVASAEQCIIDNDIMGMVRHLVSGVQVDEETLAFDAIQEVSLGDGNFMIHPHTLARFRDLYEPVAFTRRRMQDWVSKGAMSARESAADISRKILDEHFPSPLSREQVAEIEKIAEAYSSEK